MKYSLVPVLFAVFLVSCSLQKEIKPFTTDYCSCYPDGTTNVPNAWKHCCLQHDSLYWKGGTKQQRMVADSLLYTCICQAGYQNKARLMHRFVRFWGSPYFPFSWRWGYGWRFGHGYLN